MTRDVERVRVLGIDLEHIGESANEVDFRSLPAVDHEGRLAWCVGFASKGYGVRGVFVDVPAVEVVFGVRRRGEDGVVTVRNCCAPADGGPAFPGGDPQLSYVTGEMRGDGRIAVEIHCNGGVAVVGNESDGIRSRPS